MYLSKVSLQSSQQARQLLLGFGGKGAYSSHQILWQLFTEEDRRSFLFREEQLPDGSKVFYVLSSVAPKVDASLFQVQSKPFLPKLHIGQRLSYKLKANPTVSVSDKQGKSKRHDVMMHAKRVAKERGVTDMEEVRLAMELAAREWMANSKRLEGWGVSLDVLPDIEAYTQHRGDKSPTNAIRFSSVDYQGVLTVQDPDKFISQLEKGFGKSKALGCGLMLIKPI